jgi:hypothetical protein
MDGAGNHLRHNLMHELLVKSFNISVKLSFLAYLPRHTLALCITNDFVKQLFSSAVNSSFDFPIQDPVGMTL